MLSGVILASVLCCTAAFAQNRLPSGIITAADATGAKEKGEIEAFVQKHVANVKAADKDLSTSREALSLQAAIKEASPSFRTVYSDAIAKQIAAQQLDTAKDIRVRLNAAIIVARVAASTSNVSLAKLAQTFTSDPAESVAMWGIKASQPLIPAMLLSGQDPKALAEAVINAVKLHVTSEIIPEDAYRAIALSELLPDTKRASQVGAAAMQAYAQYPLELLEYRVSLYQIAMPTNAAADAVAAVFFGTERVWNSLTLPQQGQAANLLAAIIHGAADKFDNSQSDLIEVIKKTAGGLNNIGNSVKDQTIIASTKALNNIGQTTPPSTVQTLAKTVEDAVKARFSTTAVARP